MLPLEDKRFILYANEGQMFDVLVMPVEEAERILQEFKDTGSFSYFDPWSGKTLTKTPTTLLLTEALVGAVITKKSINYYQKPNWTTIKLQEIRPRDCGG